MMETSSFWNIVFFFGTSYEKDSNPKYNTPLSEPFTIKLLLFDFKQKWNVQTIFNKNPQDKIS
jgi:hypothetical protein